MTQGYESATVVRDAEGRQYHIALAPGEVARHIILVGDPERARRGASNFDSVELERTNREYVTITGRHRGLRVSVMGTGMGSASTEIAVVELCQCVERPVMIRCGSTGALQPGMALGDLVISQAAVRLENTTRFYADDTYPAVADPQAVIALAAAADGLGQRYHVGVTATSPSFYAGQGRAVAGFSPREPDIVARLARQGVKNLEMETACLLTLATLRGFVAGAVCAVYATRADDVFISPAQKDAAEKACVATGLRALHLLDAMERARGDRPIWHPGLELPREG
jgi:uridine phosphorylase